MTAARSDLMALAGRLDQLAKVGFGHDLSDRDKTILLESSSALRLAASQPDREARTGIYIASKTKHADRWRFLRDKIGEPIISTWIDEAGEGESSDLHDLWHRCLTEAASCRVLIAYREKDEVLKGGWVEIGAALSAGIPVYAVGLEEFTIAKYRGITHFPDMKAAIAASRSLLSGAGTKSDGGVEGHARMDACGLSDDSLRGGANSSNERGGAGIKPGPSDPSPGPDVREALEECKHWHERQDKALSKSGRGDADYYWQRDQHRQEIERIDAILSALTRPLGGFVQGSIARKQSSSSTSATATETDVCDGGVKQNWDECPECGASSDGMCRKTWSVAATETDGGEG